MPEWADFTAAAERPEPTVLRVRTGRISAAALVDRLAARGFTLRSKEGLPQFFEVEAGVTSEYCQRQDQGRYTNFDCSKKFHIQSIKLD